MAQKTISDLIAQYSGNLPRYTSYPTAVSFSPEVGSEEVTLWLKNLPEKEEISLYFHVPFCDELCRFCACNTSVVRQEEARLHYGELLLEELRRVVALLGHGRIVKHIHFGGGTPTTLPAQTLRRIMAEVRKVFTLSHNAEIAMELDPRHIPEGLWELLQETGFNRISFGVQDLDAQVQKTCGRIQSFEQTSECVEKARDIGIKGVNIDLIYGLPYQTEEGVIETARKVARLKPDRLAVFGYAHVPWKQKRQQLIPSEALPVSEERVTQCISIGNVLEEEGYCSIGLDHYALPDDAMTCAAEHGKLFRNFQGYTTDESSVLVGIGASAISMTAKGYSQNIPSVASYRQALNETNGLPVARGVIRTSEDCLRGSIIERIMCDKAVDLAHYVPNDNTSVFDFFSTEIAALEPFEADGIAKREGGMIRVTKRGELFLRHVAAIFDTRAKEILSQKTANNKASQRFSTSL